jgi:hypothetical protein
MFSSAGYPGCSAGAPTAHSSGQDPEKLPQTEGKCQREASPTRPAKRGRQEEKEDGLAFKPEKLREGTPLLYNRARIGEVKKQAVELEKRAGAAEKQIARLAMQGLVKDSQGVDAKQRGAHVEKQDIKMDKHGAEVEKIGAEVKNQGMKEEKHVIEVEKQGAKVEKHAMEVEKQVMEMVKQVVEAEKQGEGVEADGPAVVLELQRQHPEIASSGNFSCLFDLILH